jgi:hypothetical protein
LVEQLALNQTVGGSNPSGRTKKTPNGVFVYKGFEKVFKEIILQRAFSSMRL